MGHARIKKNTNICRPSCLSEKIREQKHSFQTNFKISIEIKVQLNQMHFAVKIITMSKVEPFGKIFLPDTDIQFHNKFFFYFSTWIFEECCSGVHGFIVR